MAKKIFLRDLSGAEVLPITRGELVLDSSGNPAFHSNEFLATESQPGLMSAEDKKRIDDLENIGPGADSKVAQVNTTTSDVYRLLFSETATDETKTEGARKSAKLTFNPSTGVLQTTALIGNLDGTYINRLTGYTKATTVAGITSEDSLSTALGKLELKADTAYALVAGAYDGDGTIENLAEILKVLEGISDTETIQAIVGKYLPLAGGTLTGTLKLDMGDSAAYGIHVLKNGTVLSRLACYNYDKWVITDAGWSKEHILYHTGNLTKLSQLTNDSGFITGSYLPLAGGWMDWLSAINFKGLNNSTSTYGTLGYRSGVGGNVMHCTSTGNYQTDGALYLMSNGATGNNDWGGIAIDNEGVTVFGAGDPGNNFTGVFRVLNEDNVGDGPLFLVTKASGTVSKYTHTISSGLLKVINNGNTIYIGSRNSGYGHIENSADIPFYFNRTVNVDGAIWKYNTDYGIAGDGKFHAHTVYANRSGSSTDGGVSLYASSAPDTYGIMFRGTSSYGTHGGVTGDWATYFTMSDTTNRGWIFRRGSTNVASISGGGNLTNSGYANIGTELFNKDQRFNYGLAYYNNNTGSVTGTFVIVLPNSWTSTMNTYEIDIYEYNGHESAADNRQHTKLYIDGYNYGDSSQWVNYGYTLVGSYNKGVRLGHNGSKCVIMLGTTSTTWSYPQVHLSRVITGYNGQTSWSTGYSISLVTSESGYSSIVTVNRLRHRFDDIIASTVRGGSGYFTGNLTLHQPSNNADSPKLLFQRGTENNSSYYDWEQYVSSGNMYFTCNSSGSFATKVWFSESGYVNASRYYATSSAGPHFMGTSAANNWAYFRLNNSVCDWDIATKSNSGSGGLWLSRYKGLDNGIFVSAADTPKVGINTSSPSYALHVTSDAYATGWVRAGSGFYVEGTGVHFTSQSSVGEIDMTANNEFLWGSTSATLYFNYRAVSRGTTVTNYIWNAGTSSSYASHTLGTLNTYGPVTITYNSYPGLTIHNNTTSGEASMYIKNNTAGWALGVNPWGVGAGQFAIGQYSGTGSSNWRFRIDNNGYCYTNSYLNVGQGNEKNASNPPYVWGVNGSDNFMRTYATSSLSVNYANSAGSSGKLYTNSIGSGSDTHASSLKNYFNNYKASIPRNSTISVYSSAYGTGSQYMGYFLNGYNDTPYGGFFVAHYDECYYVGISYGNYNQQAIITSKNIGSQSVNYASSAGSVDWANVKNKPTIPDTSGFVTLTTAQTITGAKTFNNTITFGQSDSYGIRTVTNNYGRIGESSKRFYQCYVTSYYATSGFYQDSDIRLKNILQNVEVNLDDLAKLRKVYYTWKSGIDTNKHIGMIAQEVQKLYPELVNKDENTGYLSLAYDQLSVITLKAIDELYSMIKTLREENLQLKSLLKQSN